jgi:hypothetical protein
MNRRNGFLVASVLVLVIYIATFAQWWQRGPRYTKTVAGRQVEYKEFHYTWFSWHTRLLWSPSLWIAARFSGYHKLAVATAFKDSVILYAR